MGSPDKWWISWNERFSFMGSFFGSTQAAPGQEPDSLYFANWKRLNDVSWKIPYQQGRNFNMPPYSVGDSAVCYYFEPRPLGREESCFFIIMLAAADEGGFINRIAEENPTLPEDLARIVNESQNVASSQALSAGTAAADSREKDLQLIRELIEQIDGYMRSGSINEDELAAIELVLKQMMERNGLSGL
jgi:hypothetical protein